MIREIAFLALVAASTASVPKPFYLGDNGIYTEFVTGFDKMAEKCGVAASACVTWDGPKKPRAMYLPNCCDPAWADEDYARGCCHELKHVNGWPGDHP